MFSFLFNPFFIRVDDLGRFGPDAGPQRLQKVQPSGLRLHSLSGAETARRILHQQRIYDVSVEETGGMLSDHYDPRAKAVRLSSDNFHGHHLAGLAVAAHEVGHAIQHAHGLRAAQPATRDPARRQLGLVSGPSLGYGGNNSLGPPV